MLLLVRATAIGKKMVLLSSTLQLLLTPLILHLMADDR